MSPQARQIYWQSLRPQRKQLRAVAERPNWIPLIEKDFKVFEFQDLVELQRKKLWFQCFCWGEPNWNTQKFNSLCLNGSKKAELPWQGIDDCAWPRWASFQWSDFWRCLRLKMPCRLLPKVKCRVEVGASEGWKDGAEPNGGLRGCVWPCCFWLMAPQDFSSKGNKIWGHKPCFIAGFCHVFTS